MNMNTQLAKHRFVVSLVLLLLFMIIGCQVTIDPASKEPIAAATPFAYLGATSSPEPIAPPSIVPITSITTNASPQPTNTNDSASVRVDAVVVTVDSTPSDATIYLDGRYIGRTPYQTQLFKGNYDVSIELPGFSPWQQHFTISDNAPLTVTADFTFEPQMTKILEESVGKFWWGADSQSIYFIHCEDIPVPEVTPFRLNDGAYIHKLDLSTGNIGPAEETAWPPDWPSVRYAPLIPDGIDTVWVSPSGEKVVYSQFIDINEARTLITRSLSVILDEATVIEFPPIRATTVNRVFWSHDETRIYVVTGPYATFPGHLIDLATRTVTLMDPAQYNYMMTKEDLYGAHMLRDGSGLIYHNGSTDYFSPSYILNYATGQVHELQHPIGFPRFWLDDNSRYLVHLWSTNPDFRNRDALTWFWYDTHLETQVPIIDIPINDIPLSLDDSVTISPDGQSILATEKNQGSNCNPGLWLIDLDTQ